MIFLTLFGIKEIILGTLFNGVLFLIVLYLTHKFKRRGIKFFTAVPIFLELFLLFFFRDPVRHINYENGDILSACDGFVTDIDTVAEPYYLKTKALRISVFMTMFDVHLTRSPVPGKVAFIKHNNGAHINAGRAQSAQVNENNVIGIKMDNGMPLTLKQIAGVMARKIVCAVHDGDVLKAGEKIGMIKFGSRTEVYIPDTIPVELYVRVGQHVKAGKTKLGRFLCR